MAIPNLLEAKPSKTIKPPRVFLYGVQGIGKSTFGASAPNPYFLNLEDGVDEIETTKSERLTTWRDVIDHLLALSQQDHNFQTLVVDSVDWLETLIHEQVASDKKVNSIEDIGYGKGYIFAMNYWEQFIAALDDLRNNKGMVIILIAHNQVKRFDDPTTDSYDRYNVKLHKQAGEKLMEWADAVLFAGYETFIKSEDAGFNKKVKKGAASRRLLFTRETPALIAKNRYGLPDKLDFPKEGAWSVFQSAVLENTQNKEQTNNG